MVSAKQFRSERHIERGSTNALPISRESEIEIEVRGSYLVILLGALVAGSVSFMGYVVSLAEFRPRETPLASVLLQISNNTTRDEDGALADLVCARRCLLPAMRALAPARPARAPARRASARRAATRVPTAPSPPRAAMLRADHDPRLDADEAARRVPRQRH